MWNVIISHIVTLSNLGTVLFGPIVASRITPEKKNYFFIRLKIYRPTRAKIFPKSRTIGRNSTVTLLWWDYSEAGSKWQACYLNFDRRKKVVKISRDILTTFLTRSKFKQLDSHFDHPSE
jgi:hypothetical protein